jgi:N-acetylneuraminate synthase
MVEEQLYEHAHYYLMKKIFYIAEIGINHNGILDIAKKLIDNAKLAGFDCVKFQKRTLDLVYTKEQLDAARESPWGSTQRQQKKGLEFDLDDYQEIDKHCKQKNIKWFASAWDIESLKFLDYFNTDFHKIASAMIVDIDFLKEVAKRKKYTFISTGMCKENDIKIAVDIFRSSNCPFELMHCVSTYPMKIEDANLKRIISLREKFKCKVGYSGHENALSVSYAAAMMGITSLERHITLDRTMYGSDQAASLEFRGMQELISVINRMLVASSGSGEINKILSEEKEIAKKLRMHIKNYNASEHLN